jgi:hypothetical protein
MLFEGVGAQIINRNPDLVAVPLPYTCSGTVGIWFPRQDGANATRLVGTLSGRGSGVSNLSLRHAVFSESFNVRFGS